MLVSACGSSKHYSGNPVFPGWYADPEGIIFNKEYWIFPTFSAPYKDQVLTTETRRALRFTEN